MTMGFNDYTNWQMPTYNFQQNWGFNNFNSWQMPTYNYQQNWGFNSGFPNISNFNCFSMPYTANNSFESTNSSNINFSGNTDTSNDTNNTCNTDTNNTQQNSSQELSEEDKNALIEFYANNNVLEEGIAGAATGGLSWMAFEHAQSLVHPINAKEGFKAAESIFKNVPKEFMKENSVLMQNAYIAAQQATRDTQGKVKYLSGWLRRPIGYHHPGDEKEIQKLVRELGNAIKYKNTDLIAEYTAKLQAARGMDGKLIFWGKNRSIAERLADKAKVGKSGRLSELAKTKEALLSTANGNIGNLLKNTFKKDFLGFMLMESIASSGKIVTAFKKDSSTGMKQLGQSAGKAALGTTGWCLGRAAGTWLGAKIGTLFCPGVGTAIGALIGFTVGSIGMSAGHLLGNWLLGTDVANKVEGEMLAQSKEGQQQLIEFALQKQQEQTTT